ncbi:MAG: hypothetical protein EZS28_030716 [Streblomastix strix]|uniref:Protein kinase domain-containing protein n=1 Tax=Streblomastix strix TaxID=222440 RepID=A0A5J4UTQ6_9EUKA|nr:MAG: hypothetical protein EZS28_030716 [Streblomastix strix]
MTVESDVFAVGEVIFELLSGKHPFESDSEQGMINNIIQGKMIKFPAFAEGNMKQIVLAMMNPNPSRRPSAKAVLAHDMVRMYLRQHEGRRNIDDSGRIQQLQQEKDNEKRRADEEKTRADSAEEVSRAFQLEIENKNKEIQTLQQRTQIIEQEKEREKIKADQEKIRADQEKIRADEQEGNVTRMNLQLTQKNSIIQQMAERQLSVDTHLPQGNESEDLLVLGAITSDAIIPDYAIVQQNENKFIHTKGNDNPSVVAFNPIISKVICLGIADASAVFEPNQGPRQGKNFTKTIRYWNVGVIAHIVAEIDGNCKIEEKQLVALEVNMTSNPRTLHFFVNNQEQPLSISDIPPNIRFFIGQIDPEQSFTLTRFERIQSSSARGVKGSKVLEWGYQWDEDDDYDGNSEDQEQMISNRLFVANLNFSTTGQDLGQFFEQFGQVQKAEVIIHNGRSKGFGFVTMRNQEQAQQAMNQLNNQKLDGRNIRIQFAKDQNEHNPHQNSNYGGGMMPYIQPENYGVPMMPYNIPGSYGVPMMPYNIPGNSGGGMMPYIQRGRFPSRRRFRPR